MSDGDSFIREVTEEVQRDRLYGLWRKYGPFVIGGLVAVVVAAAGLQWWDHRKEAAARDAGGRVLDALSAEAAPRRAEDLLLARDTLDGGPARLASLAAAAAYAEAGDVAEAADLYAEIAEDPEASDTAAAFAAYRAAMLRAREAGPLATEGALTPLAEADGPFRLLALEGRAAARTRLGDPAGARADLEAILADPAASEGLRQRAAEALNVLPASDANG